MTGWNLDAIFTLLGVGVGVQPAAVREKLGDSMRAWCGSAVTSWRQGAGSGAQTLNTRVT